MSINGHRLLGYEALKLSSSSKIVIHVRYLHLADNFIHVNIMCESCVGEKMHLLYRPFGCRKAWGHVDVDIKGRLIKFRGAFFLNI